jgi:hypothetical protein
MPSNSTFVVDTAATFASAICMGVIPREVFGQPGTQDRTAQGLPRWTCGVAVSYHADAASGITPPSEVLNITVNAAEDPGTSCPAGTPVAFEGLRAGVSAPEARQDGRIRGGRLFWSATAIRPASSGFRSKTDAA